MKVLEGKSDKNVFRLLDYRVPKETSGRKTRAYTIPETSAVSDLEDEQPECPVAVSEEEIITSSAIHDFCKDQSISDISMTFKDIIEKATSIPGTPSICNDLKEQEENIILAFSKVASTNLYSPPSIVGHLNMVKYWAKKQMLQTLSGSYLNVFYKDLGLVYFEDFHETFSCGFKCIVSSVRASMIYDSNSPPPI